MTWFNSNTSSDSRQTDSRIRCGPWVVEPTSTILTRTEKDSLSKIITKLINNAKDKLANVNENPNEFVVIRDRIRGANENLELANEKVTEILSRLQIQIDGQYTKQEDDVASISSNVTQVSYKGNTGGTNVKLPKLELRNFKGELADWTLFWKQFRTVVHENKSLDAVAKFNYLEHALIGKAAATISGLTPSEKSYNAAIELLKHEYGNQQRIIDSHVQKLLSLTPIKSQVDAVGLRNLYNTTSSITRNLTSLGVKAEEYGMMVKSVILNSMPYGLKIDYYKQYPNTENAVDIAEQLNNLLNYLKLEVESIEIAQPAASAYKSSSSTFNSNKDDKRNKNVNRNFIERKQYTAAGLLTMVELKLMSQYNDESIPITAIEVPEICFDSFLTPNVNHPMLTTLNMADVSIGNAAALNGIVLLIGADNRWKFATGEFIRLSGDLTAVNTKLGWTLQGPSINESANDIKQFWELEAIGINDKQTNNNVIDEFIENNIIMKDGRFEVSPPWKSDGAMNE
ncbi:hypothetical protein ILUMI_11195 [Ignelater luminosus]|uniref:Uncharacterized protein n=1 Tax=Ignelater luminosus TaxID=2038154 RepID=A0A8K0D0W9_IGNLU|nr:hypothetical protein ILUMI_11195 [Ignelater luminosus]